MSHFFDPQTLKLLIGAGLVVGGFVGGVIGALKLPVVKNEKHPGNDNGIKQAIAEIKDKLDKIPIIEKSIKTSGALHVSEEGLQKIVDLQTTLKEDYLTKEKHTDLCKIQQGEIVTDISKAVQDSTRQILAAITSTGGWHSGPS